MKMLHANGSANWLLLAAVTSLQACAVTSPCTVSAPLVIEPAKIQPLPASARQSVMAGTHSSNAQADIATWRNTLTATVPPASPASSATTR